MRIGSLASVAGALLLAACESYHPLPLSPRASLATDLSQLHHEGVDISQPLTVANVASLAVQNNPTLVADRNQRGLAKAQLLQAGLLPNPSINPNYAFNTFAPNALNNAWVVALSYDLRSLILTPTARLSARYAGKQVDAQLLWQEWQVAGQARLLVVDLIEGNRQRASLDRTYQLLASRYAHSSSAMAQGNLTLNVVMPDLSALQGAEQARQTLERAQQQRRQQLDALLGLKPSVVLDLVPTPILPPFDPALVRARLPDLPTYRPDLIALQMGYKSQDAKVRQAIIGQFPTFVLGLAGGIDNTHDYTVGPSPTFDIPIFNHNQGQIAIERATRKLLHDQYSARLATADGEVRAALDTIALQRRQLASLRRDVGKNASAAAAAESAWRAGIIDELTYVTFISARLSQEQQILTLEQSILDAEVNIATLTGAGLPPFVQAKSPSDQREARL